MTTRGGPATLAPRMLDVGSVVAGRYRVEGELGRGGMGTVLVARHLVLGERVALKFVAGLRGDGGADESARPRLLREARAAARLRSDYIVRVLDVLELEAAEDDGDICLVLEHVDGPTLARALADRGAHPVDEAVTLVLQIAVGLAEAHAHGVVHRDLKPANVLLATLPNGRIRPRIIDFGVAKAPAVAGDAAQTTLTAAGALLGSPAYMAPEQIADARRVDARADVWSLGIVLCEALTGRLPFEALTTTGLLARIVGDPPRSPADLRPGLDADLAAIVLRCLEKDPSARFDDVAALGRALAPFATGGAALADEIAETLARKPVVREPTATDEPLPRAQELTATDEPAPRAHELTATDEPAPRAHELTATDEPAPLDSFEVSSSKGEPRARPVADRRSLWAALALTAAGLVVTIALLGQAADPLSSGAAPRSSVAATDSATKPDVAPAEPAATSPAERAPAEASAPPARSIGVALAVPAVSGRPRTSARPAGSTSPPALTTRETVPEATPPPDVFDRLGPRK